MSRMTPADRDRAVRIISALTGGITVAAVAATGVTTALAAATTHERQETGRHVARPATVSGAAHRAASAARTHRVTGSTHSTVTSGNRAVTKPKPHRSTVAPPPPTTTSGS